MESCAAISINTDITGPGVRFSLYAQSLLTVILVRISPADATNAYWSMTATAISLIVSSIISAALRDITLLDAIVVTYVLMLPIVASAFGVAHISSQSSKGLNPSLRRPYSPLLVLVNWLRSALTYAFALFVWIQVPAFGSGPPECDRATRFIFFGISLPSLGAGRNLNLIGWSILAALFAWRTYRGMWTLQVALRGIFYQEALIKPRELPNNELEIETLDRYTFHTGEHEHTETIRHPRPDFHQIMRGIINQVLGLAPTGIRAQDHWYFKYSQSILAALISAWAITMTELELRMNPVEGDLDKRWGFGQILPLVLTISPFFSLCEAMLSARARGTAKNSTQTLRVRIVGATCLKRPVENPEPTSADPFDPSQNTPSPFAVIAIDGVDTYHTFARINTENPKWDESFDVQMSEASTMVIRIFDTSVTHRGQPALLGYTSTAIFSTLFPGGHARGEASSSSTVAPHGAPTDPAFSQTLPLVLDRKCIPGASVTYSISPDISTSPPCATPPHEDGARATFVRTKVTHHTWGGRNVGSRETIRTDTYRLRPYPTPVDLYSSQAGPSAI